MRSRPIALGGVTAALAIVIMCMGGMIPLATFICPMLCMVLLQILLKPLGSRFSWVWYTAVAVLSLLLSPDKEAAFVFTFLGYYPIIKERFLPNFLCCVLKVVYFNTSVLLMYQLMIYLFGMDQILTEFEQMGKAIGVITLLLGNLTFFMVDRLLTVLKKKV